VILLQLLLGISEWHMQDKQYRLASSHHCGARRRVPLQQLSLIVVLQNSTGVIYNVTSYEGSGRYICVARKLLWFSCHGNIS